MNNQELSNSKKKTWKIICYFSIVFFLLVLFFVANTLSNNYFTRVVDQYINNNPISYQEKACIDCERRNIDGVYVNKDHSNLFPFAVMIDNHPDARPAYGLSKANLVIEAEVEGGITRYFAVFAGDEEIEKIGPIRSVRPYFVDWTEELSALLVHCGGSPEALTRIIKEDVHNLNEFYNEKLFWRDKNISAPHNIFSSTEMLREYLLNKNLEEGKYLSWNFVDEISRTETPHSEVSIDYYSAVLANDFAVKWKYDKVNNNYIRHLGGSIHRDGDENEIRFANIIIQYTEKEILDEKLRLSLNTIGEGKAIICIEGVCEEGKWTKTSTTSRTRFYDTNDKEITFLAGNIWIEVVDNSIEVSY